MSELKIRYGSFSYVVVLLLLCVVGDMCRLHCGWRVSPPHFDPHSFHQLCFDVDTNGFVVVVVVVVGGDDDVEASLRLSHRIHRN
jgi:hypothetical protein